MTDSNDDNDRGRPRGRPARPHTSGDRPFRSRDGDKPFRPKREGDAKPFRARTGGDRPRKPREDNDRPFRSRDGDAKPFRARGGEDRLRRPHGDNDRPRRFERSGEDRPHRDRETAEPEQKQEIVPVEPTEERIAKVVARAGIASRRDVEAMIAEGRVTLNGEVLTSPAINVTPADKITVDGEPLPAKERTRLWLFHKPRGLVTTARDPEGRPTVFDNLPEDMPRVVAIGRLDINTEGLLLLTNDGGLARTIAHPDTGWLRRYKVRAHGEVNQADLDQLRNGVTVDGMEYGPVEARLDRIQGDNAWITLGLREGKNREVKRILEHLGLQVNRLIRLSFGPFQLGELEDGLVEEVRTKVLRDQLGEALAAEAQVDFESPVREPIAPFGPAKKAEHVERGGRLDRDRRQDRPRRRDEGERPFRRGPERDDRSGEPERKRPSRLEPRNSIWRAGEDSDSPRKKAPRRGADPKVARAASGERKRERVGAIETDGRKVRVERLVSAPRDESAPPRRSPRPAPSAEDRPRRRNEGFSRPPRDDDRPRRPSGDRPLRSRDGDSERPRRPRPEGDRPFRGDKGDKPFRARSDSEKSHRGPPRGDRSPGRSGPGGSKGGFKGGPRGGGFKGGPRGGGGPKGGPRGRHS